MYCDIWGEQSIARRSFFLPAMVTSACLGYPTATPMPLASINTSNLSSPSTMVSLTIGMDTVTSVSPGNTAIIIGVSSKSATIEAKRIS